VLAINFAEVFRKQRLVISLRLWAEHKLTAGHIFDCW